MALARGLINAPSVLWSRSRPAVSTAPRQARSWLCFPGCVPQPGAIVVVTHDPRVATTADRVLSMRDGQIVDETQLGELAAGALADLIDLGDGAAR